MEPDEPPRKNYEFKEREFKRDNPVSSKETPPPTAKELAMMAGPGARSSPPAANQAKPADPNDVYAMLKENRAAAQRDHLNEVVIKSVKSRRKRDYWLMLVTANSALFLTAAVGRANAFVLGSALAGMVIISIGLTWVMWFIIDDY